MKTLEKVIGEYERRVGCLSSDEYELLQNAYVAGLLRAQELAKEHAVAIPIYIDDADIDWEDFDNAIIEEAAKER